MTNETASLNLNSGPPLMPWNARPASVKSTVRVSPALPLGLSAGDGETWSIQLSGKIEV